MADTPTTPSSNLVMDWLREMVNRLKSKNPKFFNVIVTAGIIATALTGLPQWVASIEQLHITLPIWLADIQSDVVAWAGVISAFISQLTVNRDPVIVSEEKVVTETTVEKLPFTVKAEAVAAEKEAAKF